MVPVLCFRLATFASPQTRNLRFTLAPQSKDYSVVLLLYHFWIMQQVVHILLAIDKKLPFGNMVI